jgi:hypothetical protein
MSKKRMQTPESEPEPGLELSPSGSWVSLLTLSLAGAGLPEALERLADKSGIEVDLYTGVAQVRTDDLDVMLGDRAPAIREVLDDSDFMTEAEAAEAMGIGVEVVVGLAQRRGCPTMIGDGGEVLVSRRLWENLRRLLSAEGREFDGGFSDDSIDWLLRHRLVTEALKSASSFVWDDPWYKPVVLKPRALRAFEAACQAVAGPPRPAREPTVKFDEDEEYRILADRVGVRYSIPIGDKSRTGHSAFLGWDLFRLCGLPVDNAVSPRDMARETAYEKLRRDSYAATFPDADLSERAMIRAELESRIRQSELAGV